MHLHRRSIVFETVVALVIAILAVMSGGCTFWRASQAAMQSTDHFLVRPDEQRVLYEPGAERNADRIAEMLPGAIQQTEESHFRPFPQPVEVYICSSRESFIRLYGNDVRAGVLTKLFLSPRVFEEDEEIIYMYLVHELSHLLLLQQLGTYKMSRLPFWFKEGLATYVSDGGGAHLVSEDEAKEAIQAERYFIPNEKGGFIFQNTPHDWDMKPHMFYRQSEMFFRFLKGKDDEAFKQLLVSAQNGVSLSESLGSAYDRNLEELWQAFIRKMRQTG